MAGHRWTEKNAFAFDAVLRKAASSKSDRGIVTYPDRQSVRFAMPTPISVFHPATPLVMADPSDKNLAAFHRGDRRVLQACYEDTFASVEQSVAGLLTGADRETVVQDVYFRLMTDAEFRLTFQGGSLVSWLRTVARNRAIDFRRRYYDREQALPNDGDVASENEDAPSIESTVDAQMLLEKIRTRLPAKWLPVFEQRFVQGLSQREAATALGQSRTTLAYQEIQIRRLLQKALKNGDFE